MPATCANRRSAIRTTSSRTRSSSRATARRVRALNINTIDEVPDSSWFTNRAGAQPLSADEVRRGPDTDQRPGARASGPWSRARATASPLASPSATAPASRGSSSSIPTSNPEMATGAEMVATKLFWALGFHVPENHLAVLRRDNLVRRRHRARIRDLTGQQAQADRGRSSTQLLTRGARKDDGTFRVIASKALCRASRSGRTATTARGPTIPNDIHPARASPRAARPARVLGVAQSRRLAQHQLARHLVERQGRKVVWHHLIDFGSTLGSASLVCAEAAGGQRVHLGGAADGDHGADARPLRAAVDSRASTRTSSRSATSRPRSSSPSAGSPSIRTRRSSTRRPTTCSGRRGRPWPSRTRPSAPRSRPPSIPIPPPPATWRTSSSRGATRWGSRG